MRNKLKIIVVEFIAFFSLFFNISDISESCESEAFIFISFSYFIRCILSVVDPPCQFARCSCDVFFVLILIRIEHLKAKCFPCTFRQSIIVILLSPLTGRVAYHVMARAQTESVYLSCFHCNIRFRDHRESGPALSLAVTYDI